MNSVATPVPAVLLKRVTLLARPTFVRDDSVDLHPRRAPARKRRSKYSRRKLISIRTYSTAQVEETSNDAGIPPPPPPQSNPPAARTPELKPDIIHRLISNPALYEPVRTPRYPIVLCHGLYGFDSRGLSLIPAIKMEYWSNVLHILRRTVGATVIVTSVPPTGSITQRAKQMDHILRTKCYGRGVNFLGHSMGGLDVRHLISHLKPVDYVPLSLMSVSTPHHGSPFMDWCAENMGLGRLRRDEIEAEIADGAAPTPKTPTVAELASNSNDDTSQTKKPTIPGFSLSLSSLPSSLTTLLSSVLDSPAYSNLTSTYLRDEFNPSTPDSPSVKYFSVAARCGNMSVWHPLWLPKLVLDGYEEKLRQRMREQGDPRAADDNLWGNDGIVTIQSSQWGEFLGVLNGCDHWEIRGARGIELSDFQDVGDALHLPSVDWRKLLGWKKEPGQHNPDIPKGDERKATELISERKSESKPEDDSTPEQNSDPSKLSSVFDWLAEKVPSPPKLTSSSKSSAEQDVHSITAKEKEKPKIINELETKEDLERFYVALARKLYDEGL